MTESDRWTPILRGDVYCSPACGNNCTVYEYEAAKLNAESLAKSLGPKWTPHVWENLGWHYRATLHMEDLNAHASVYPHTHNGVTTFFALIGDGDIGGWPVSRDADDEKRAQGEPHTALNSAWRDLAKDIEFDKDCPPMKEDDSEKARKWRVVNYLDDLFQGSGWQKRDTF